MLEVCKSLGQSLRDMSRKMFTFNGEVEGKRDIVSLDCVTDSRRFVMELGFLLRTPDKITITLIDTEPDEELFVICVLNIVNTDDFVCRGGHPDDMDDPTDPAYHLAKRLILELMEGRIRLKGKLKLSREDDRPGDVRPDVDAPEEEVLERFDDAYVTFASISPKWSGGQAIPG